MYLDWVKCSTDDWCFFDSVDLDNEYFNNAEGVYLIFTSKGRCVKIGHGNIREGLREDRINKKIKKYTRQDLKVSWVSVSQPYWSGIEAFLGELLVPLIGVEFYEAEHINVNIPDTVIIPW